MKIKQSILDKINTPLERTKIALELGCGENGIAIQLRLNKANGRMTKMDALQAISKVSGHAVEDILEQEPAQA